MNIPNDKDVQNYIKYLKKKVVTEEGGAYTHTAFGPPWGKFNIDDDDLDTFLNLYKRALLAFENSNVQGTLHITEKPKRVGPMVIDLDFRQNSKDRKYTAEHIQYVVHKFNERITKYIKTPKTNLNAFVFEKEIPSEDEKQKNFKDGFHIIYPNFTIDASLRYLILEETRDEIAAEGVLEDINFTNTYEDIFDIAVIFRNGWFMYGSRKNNGQQYKLTSIYDYEMNKKDHTRYSSDELVVLLCLRQHDPEDIARFKPEYNTDEFKSRLDNVFDRYHSKKKTKVNLADININNGSEIANARIKEKLINAIDKRPNASKRDIEMARKLTKILSKERATSYETWVCVGWALYNIDDSLLGDFIEFSKKNPEKYHDGCCERVWEKAHDNGGLTLSSLYWWAAEDNATEYIKLMRESINDHLDKAKTGSHDDIAKLVYELYKHVYRCASITKNIWYEFQGHKWVRINDAYTLSNKLSDEVTKEFAALASIYFAEMDKKTAQERDLALSTGKEILKIVEKLKNQPFKNCIVEACAKRFHDPKFEERLDNDPFLLGFENGIYDLKNKCFRAGTPDDYITMSTGYDYKEFNKTDKEILEIEEFFSKIMTEADMKLYTLTLYSSYLDGVCKDQNFVLITGGGGNGKSANVNLMSFALGSYFGVLPTTVITQKRKSSSGATPELADKRGKRMLVIQEPEHDDVIYVGNMKNLTGADWIEARALYGDPFRYKPQFKLMLTCNKMPHIPSYDGGTWRRVRAVPYESKFVDGKPANAREFPKDRGLEERMKKWGPAFMWLLLNVYYPIYDRDGLNVPEKVMAFTDKYKKDTDTYYEYLRDVMVITKDKKDQESISVVYNNFKSWYFEGYSVRAPARKDFINYLIDAGYKLLNGSIRGMRFRGPDDKMDDSDDESTSSDDNDNENNDDNNDDMSLGTEF